MTLTRDLTTTSTSNSYAGLTRQILEDCVLRAFAEIVDDVVLDATTRSLASTGPSVVERAGHLGARSTSRDARASRVLTQHLREAMPAALITGEEVSETFMPEAKLLRIRTDPLDGTSLAERFLMNFGVVATADRYSARRQAFRHEATVVVSSSGQVIVAEGDEDIYTYNLMSTSRQPRELVYREGDPHTFTCTSWTNERLRELLSFMDVSRFDFSNLSGTPAAGALIAGKTGARIELRPSQLHDVVDVLLLDIASDRAAVIVDLTGEVIDVAAIFGDPDPLATMPPFIAGSPAAVEQILAARVAGR